MPVPIKLGVSFTDTEATAINDAFDIILSTFNSKAPVNLTKDERSAVQSVAARRLPYVERCFNDLMPNYKLFLPQFLDEAAAIEDYKYLQQTRSMEVKAAMVAEVLGDHNLSAGQLAFQAMRDYYDVAKRGAERNVPGADTVVDALSPLFEQANTPAPTPVGGGGGGQ